MPIEISFMDDGAGVRYSFSGLVTGKELIDVNSSLFSSEDQLKKIRYAIVDQTRMDSLDLSIDDLKRIEQLDRSATQVNPCVVVALIVEKDLHYNVTSAWDVRTHDISWEKKIFRSKNEAYDWLREKIREKFGREITITA